MGVDFHEVVDLGANLRKLAQKVPEVIAPIIGENVEDYYNHVYRDCPVDTGNARHSIDWEPKGPALQYTVVGNANGLAPYITKLEDGWSKQAPVGMFKKNIPRTVRNIERDTAEAIARLGVGE